MKYIYALLLGIGIILLAVFLNLFGLGMKTLNTAGERVIFEHSYQKFAADKARANILRAELSKINILLRSAIPDSVDETDLLARKATIEVQLQGMI